MSAVDDGGAAFAAATDYTFQQGMTLRDYFAAQAMNGLMRYPNGGATPTEWATAAYQFADAMIAARKAKT